MSFAKQLNRQPSLAVRGELTRLRGEPNAGAGCTRAFCQRHTLRGVAVRKDMDRCEHAHRSRTRSHFSGIGLGQGPGRKSARRLRRNPCGSTVQSSSGRTNANWTEPKQINSYSVVDAVLPGLGGFPIGHAPVAVPSARTGALSPVSRRLKPSANLLAERRTREALDRPGSLLPRQPRRLLDGGTPRAHTRVMHQDARNAIDHSLIQAA